MRKIFAASEFIFFVSIIIIGCGPSYVTVRTRPKPPVYARPVAPGSNYFWIEDDWIRSGHGYVYRRGYWAAPRARYHQYIPGHWQHRRHGWIWLPGHWN